MKHNLPRYNLQGQKISNRFCALNETTDECNWMLYGESLGIVAAFGLAMGLLCLVLFILLFLLEFCATCCCRCKCFKRKKPFKERTLKIFKIILICVGGVMIGTFSAAMARNKTLHDGVTNVLSIFIDTGDEIYEDAKRFNRKLSKWVENGVVTVDLSDALSQVEGIKTQSLDTQELVENYDGQRQTGTYIVFIVPTVCFIAACVFALIFHKGTLGVFLSIFILINATLLWIIFSVHFSFGLVLNDLCYELDGKDENGPIQKGYLDVLLDCSASSVFEIYIEAIQDVMDEATSNACSAASTMCDTKSNSTDGEYSCTNDPSNCTEDNVGNFKAEPIYIFVEGCYDSNNPYNNQTCGETSNPECSGNLTYTSDSCMKEITIEECRTECPNEEDRDASDQFVTGLDDYAEFQELLEEAKALVNCDKITNVWVETEDTICGEINTGMNGLADTAGVSGSFIIIGCLVLVLGKKKFNQKKKKDTDDSSDIKSDTTSSIEMGKMTR